MTNLEEQDWSGLSRMIRQLRVLYFSIFGHHIKAKEYILGFYF